MSAERGHGSKSRVHFLGYSLAPVGVSVWVRKKQRPKNGTNEKQKSSKSDDFEDFWYAARDSPPGLLVRRLSQSKIGAILAPICAFCHRSLGGYCVVSVRPCPFQFHSGSKLGQAQSSRIPLTSRVELIYIERGSPGRKLFGLFSYIPK